MVSDRFIRASQPKAAVGFEPTIGFRTTDLQSVPLDHSGTRPTYSPILDKQAGMTLQTIPRKVKIIALFHPSKTDFSAHEPLWRYHQGPIDR